MSEAAEVQKMLKDTMDALKSAEVRDGIATVDLSPLQISISLTALCRQVKNLQEQLAAARAEAQELRVRLRVVRAALSMHGTALEEIDAAIERQEG